jgi:hypothetical protein
MRFVSESDQPPPGETHPISLDRRLEVATRLRSAVGLGDVSDIQDLAQHLLQGSPAEVAFGERINRLAMSFDFGALSELADSLTTT